MYKTINIWIYHAFREIGWADEVIYCILMPVMSSTQMEIALRSDSILRVAMGSANVCTFHSFQYLKMHCSGFPSLPQHCALLNSE